MANGKNCWSAEAWTTGTALLKTASVKAAPTNERFKDARMLSLYLIMERIQKRSGQ
ncbi:hypothetical protein EMIT0P44_630004 [Pseudomonas sp. IT-P44]